VDPRALSTPVRFGDVADADAGLLRSDLEAVGDLLQADLGTFLRPRRILAEAVDQPMLVTTFAVDEGVVDCRAAQIHSRYNSHLCSLVQCAQPLIDA
jgi:hypothetical protein